MWLLEDVQSSPDTRGVTLQRVGVKNVATPLKIKTKGGPDQVVQACATLWVDLPKECKGTHMSRFIEVLGRWQQKSLMDLEGLVVELKDRLRATSAGAVFDFKYFLPKAAPVSGLVAYGDIDCQLEAQVGPLGYQYRVGIVVSVTSLCPCSKEISDYGAHNQRSHIRVMASLALGATLWLEDLARDLEQFGSCPIFPLLKREDEKWVTERAYENPRFVEDMMRDVILYLRRHPAVQGFVVEVENFESIHNHSAYASHRE